MNRQPIAHKGDDKVKANADFRVISMPNGMWRAQHKRGEGSQTHDPWEPIGPITDQVTAIALMNGKAAAAN